MKKKKKLKKMKKKRKKKDEKEEKKEKEEKVVYSNVNSRTNDTLNSSDSRLDLNTSTNSQV